ncbi:hypothetical protein EDB85DRAFT_1893717 [Lactarius pseudohatsudake]|nr:hypothetical protein EDB85DRAFT_1893717 [Lactarius pseudohatsudake]
MCTRGDPVAVRLRFTGIQRRHRDWLEPVSTGPGQSLAEVHLQEQEFPPQPECSQFTVQDPESLCRTVVVARCDIVLVVLVAIAVVVLIAIVVVIAVVTVVVARLWPGLRHCCRRHRSRGRRGSWFVQLGAVLAKCVMVVGNSAAGAIAKTHSLQITTTTTTTKQIPRFPEPNDSGRAATYRRRPANAGLIAAPNSTAIPTGISTTATTPSAKDDDATTTTGRRPESAHDDSDDENG